MLILTVALTIFINKKYGKSETQVGRVSSNKSKSRARIQVELNLVSQDNIKLVRMSPNQSEKSSALVEVNIIQELENSSEVEKVSRNQSENRRTLVQVNIQESQNSSEVEGMNDAEHVERNTNSGETSSKFQTAVCSITAVCITTLVFISFLDIAALSYSYFLPDQELGYIYHRDYPGTPHDVLFHIPLVVLLCDTVVFMVCIVAVIIHFTCCKSYCCSCDNDICCVSQWCTAGVIAVCGVSGVLNHFPYIAMAYLDDPYHATSLFVFYIIIICGLFILTFTNYQGLFKSAKSSRSVCFVSILVIFQCFLFLGMMAVIGCFFYFLPIDKSISKAPNELLSIHQTVFLLVGAFALYRSIIGGHPVEGVKLNVPYKTVKETLVSLHNILHLLLKVLEGDHQTLLYLRIIHRTQTLLTASKYILMELRR